MAYEEKKSAAPGLPHRLTLDERRKLTVTGVEEVVSFCEEEVRVRTVKGLLVIRGEGLRVEQLGKESGELTVSGSVDELSYEAEAPERGLLARLLR